MKQGNIDIIEEVNDEINSALKDPRGLLIHQRRLAFCLSIGAVALIEQYFEKKEVLKTGARVNHEWLKKKKDNVKKLISNQITIPVGEIKNIDAFLDLAYEIEKERNEWAYGKKVLEETLKEKINLFLNFKKKIENE